MLAGLFYFETSSRNVFSGRDVDMGPWHDAVKCFGGDTLLWVDLEGSGKQPSHDDSMTQQGYTMIEEALDVYPEATIVLLVPPQRDPSSPDYLPPEGSVSLSEFEHPVEPVIYVVGPDGGTCPSIDRPHIEVNIPSYREIWAQQALVIALSDRYSKS